MILDARLANSPKWYAKSPPGLNMRVPPDILKSVVFLEEREAKGSNRQWRPVASAFVASVPGAEKRLTGYEHLYVVSARHSIIKIGNKPQSIRVNAKEGGVRHVKINGEGDWTVHPTDSRHVDVAVMPFEAAGLDVEPIPIEMFLTDEEMYLRYIGPGDEITIPGLFSRATGDSKNVPIVRRGTLAMIPDEMIRADMGDRTSEDIKAYLIEVRSVGGISGSPAFVRAPVGLDYRVVDRAGNPRLAKVHAQADYYLLGIVHGHWETRAEELNKYDMTFTDSQEPESINTGIAIVIPAKQVLEVLNHPELVSLREAAEMEAIESEGTTTPD